MEITTMNKYDEFMQKTEELGGLANYFRGALVGSTMEVSRFETFHPRAVKLMRKCVNFLVVAEHEPYFVKVYSLIRAQEKKQGTWTEDDERLYAEKVDQVLIERERCHADRDGDCEWEHCPQLRDGEPERSGRHCPLDHWDLDDID